MPQRDKELSLGRGETDMSHRQMTVYKAIEGNPVSE